MGPEGQKSGTPFLVFLSLCLSLFAVVLSVIALLMASDENGLSRKARQSQEIRSVKWDWEGKIARVERCLERARSALSKSGEKAHESADEEVGSVIGELQTWLKAGEPRLQDFVAELSKQAQEARTALREHSDKAAEKLTGLSDSLHSFREKVGLKKRETPPEEGSKDQPKK